MIHAKNNNGQSLSIFNVGTVPIGDSTNKQRKSGKIRIILYQNKYRTTKF